MHFTSLISIATLVLGIYSIPTPDNPHYFSPDVFYSNSLCGETSWNPNSNGAPLVSDCNKLKERMQKQKFFGYLLYGWQPGDDEDTFLPLAYEGTCVFGVSVINATKIPASIAQGDMADLLSDAIQVRNSRTIHFLTGDFRSIILDS
ncbi:hypothetical protein F4680DRAFT_445828 [Xylaria scruposa]|nr:hypothetical protein F4680DRAFT_445828 [Xylaria scruposa]